MMHYHKFYEELRTIDYGLLCVDLYHLAELPVIPELPLVEEETKWASGHEEGSEEDQQSAIAALREIANTPIKEFRQLKPEPNEGKLQTVTSDWDHAVWVEYRKTGFGNSFVQHAFDNKSIDAKPGLAQIEGPLQDILPLPPDKIQIYQNRLIDLAHNLASSSDTIWSDIRKTRKFPEEPLWWSLRPLEQFHRYMSSDFATINYPPFGQEDKLYFGRKFLVRYDELVERKIELIHLFVSKINSLIGITPNSKNDPIDNISASQSTPDEKRWHGKENKA